MEGSSERVATARARVPLIIHTARIERFGDYDVPRIYSQKDGIRMRERIVVTSGDGLACFGRCDSRDCEIANSDRDAHGPILHEGNAGPEAVNRALNCC